MITIDLNALEVVGLVIAWCIGWYGMEFIDYLTDHRMSRYLRAFGRRMFGKQR